jgi:hypothetical protein
VPGLCVLHRRKFWCNWKGWKWTQIKEEIEWNIIWDRITVVFLQSKLHFESFYCFSPFLYFTFYNKRCICMLPLFMFDMFTLYICICYSFKSTKFCYFAVGKSSRLLEVVQPRYDECDRPLSVGQFLTECPEYHDCRELIQLTGFKANIKRRPWFSNASN